jgi:hypothetical protein
MQEERIIEAKINKGSDKDVTCGQHSSICYIEEAIKEIKR